MLVRGKQRQKAMYQNYAKKSSGSDGHTWGLVQTFQKQPHQQMPSLPPTHTRYTTQHLCHFVWRRINRIIGHSTQQKTLIDALTKVSSDTAAPTPSASTH